MPAPSRTLASTVALAAGLALFGVAQADARTTAPQLDAVPCNASTGLCLTDRPTEPAGEAPSVPSDDVVRGPFVQVSLGDDHTCALTVLRGVECWGRDDKGQLGNGGSNTDSGVPVPVTGLDSGVRSVSAGGEHTCAVKLDNTAYCWGDDDNGQLGDGGTKTDSTVPVALAAPLIPANANVASIDAGGDHTCAVTTANEAYCWGDDDKGQIGDGGFIPLDPPDFLSPVGPVLTDVASISAGKEFSCAVTTVQLLHCWGDNSDGQLGNNSALPNDFFDNKTAPVAVVGPLSGTAVSVSAGGDHACAVTTTNALYCWGDDDKGQLGDGGVIDNVLGDSSVPILISLPTGATARSVTAGDNQTCSRFFFQSDGRNAAFCWGDDPAGQLGDGEIGGGPRATPFPVVGMSDGVDFVGTGKDHSCALTSTRFIACWGDDEDAQLGNGGNNDDSATPSLVVEN